ncbi:HAD hydrolase family protein [Litorihabitans aurantiacus]|uniref:Hydrolase n=1 Tax=Litorihabitans aurantiacus TaxID=1930061 RepID=A0AA37XGJ5_9MICO|nr:HAD family hydrolase [Litorihabitans aurantiacus]GMA32852.1 hydrolase [Litorihabitans aurantiacus]
MSAPDIRLIAIDLDGTLLDSGKQLDPDFPALLSALTERGIAVVPASGRQHESIRLAIAGADPVADQAPQDAPVGAGREAVDALAIIAENGALAARGGEVVALDGVPAAAVAHVLDAVARYTAGGGTAAVVLAGAHTAWVGTDAVAALPDFVTTAQPYYPMLEVVPDLREIEGEVLKIAVWDPNGSETGVATAIGEVPGSRVLISAGVWVDVMSPTADKGTALAALQDELGITPAQTMAFGDFPNDLGMLARAEWSYAMAGAHPEVTAAARYTAPSNDDSGVVRTIREVLAL